MRDFRLSDLPFHVEKWDRDDLHVEELLAAGTNALLARAAFEKAVAMYPESILTLRHVTHVLAEHRPDKPYRPPPSLNIVR